MLSGRRKKDYEAQQAAESLVAQAERLGDAPPTDPIPESAEAIDADVRPDHQHLGHPGYRDVNLPSGTALAGAWDACDIYIGSEFRIDVSSEAGTRFDQNVTGFRGEEEFGFNAEPYVRTGKFVKILGL